MSKAGQIMGLAAGSLCAFCGADPTPAVDEHIKVYYEQGRFGGWPANFGVWQWENEILVGYARGYYRDLGDRHHIDRERPEEHWFARSLDGGLTWTHENPAEKGQIIPEGKALHGTETPDLAIPPYKQCPGGINFTHPDFALVLRMNNIDAGQSRFYYSYDRGHNWEGPFALPNFDTPGIMARTDYLVEDQDSCLLFLTAGKQDGKEGRPLAVRTDDGGASWQFVSWIGPEPGGYAIMPASARVGESQFVVAIRHMEGDRHFADAYRSEDNGKTWKELPRPVEDLGFGNPQALLHLQDGRLCLIYGVRAEPWRICAKLSGDKGDTWTSEIVLRDDGASRDVGYPRAVQRPDGKVVAFYYFNDKATGPERYIGATIFDPSKIAAP
ncbi:MAG: exo-alpha-sialidase [Candidatus Hydrogenedentes bacterium]|nr:exo-alpha-sialidase [Candidatus Hydrogenedentota bacterium]